MFLTSLAMIFLETSARSSGVQLTDLSGIMKRSIDETCKYLNDFQNLQSVSDEYAYCRNERGSSCWNLI